MHERQSVCLAGVLQIMGGWCLLAVRLRRAGLQVGADLQHDGHVWRMCWSGEGLQLAVSCDAGAGKGASVHVWDLRPDGTFGEQPSVVYRAASA